MKKGYHQSTVLFFLFFVSTVSYGNNCHGHFVNPVMDVCWSCLFPMTLGSTEVTKGHMPDTKNPASPICSCPARFLRRAGITFGYWEPIAMVDITRHPYCFVNIGGVQLTQKMNRHEGKVEFASPHQNGSFYYAHWYKFPVVNMLNLLTEEACFEKEDFDIAYLTELDPTWGDSELSFLIHPEVAVVANAPAQMACAADSVAAAKGLPIDKLFWCAGAQGTLYPLTGHVQEHVGGVQSSVLLSERMTFKLHREMVLSDTSPHNLCEPQKSPMLTKSRYRYQMVNPVPTTNSKGCQPFGRTTSAWGSWREFPYKGEDFGYLIWRKTNCCMF